MRIIANSREMKQWDLYTISHFKMPSMVLMERAALGVVEELAARKVDCSKTLVACGMGNNGGDGLAVARLLHQRGYQVTVLLTGNEEKASEETRQQLAIVRQYGILTVTELLEETYTLVVDALFGIGLSRELAGEYRMLVEELNRMEGEKLAIDMPSGVDGNNGQVLGCAFRADLTVTFAYEKIGLLLYPGNVYAGEVAVKEIGIGTESRAELSPSVYAFEQTDLHLLPQRNSHSNKGSYGHVLVVAGRKNMSGAAFFSAKAAAVTGCGLVKIMTAEENRVILQQQFPEAVLDAWTKDDQNRKTFQDGQRKDGFWSDDFLRRLKENLLWADAVVVGPGLGTDESAKEITEAVLGMASSPVILDADALNIVSKDPAMLRDFSGEAIVTPHLGEMARLVQISIQNLQKDMIRAASAFADAYQVICVLKDERTVTALPEGICYLNTSGNHGMATGGAGDVLTGILAGLVAQGLKAREAAPLGVYLHGLSGDEARKRTGCYSMLATDMIEGIKEITKQAECARETGGKTERIKGTAGKEER